MAYRIPLNIAVPTGTNPVPTMWLNVDGPLAVGQAMGVMGLTYSTLTYTNINIQVLTSEGQGLGVKLNAY